MRFKEYEAMVEEKKAAKRAAKNQQRVAEGKAPKEGLKAKLDAKVESMNAKVESMTIPASELTRNRFGIEVEKLRGSTAATIGFMFSPVGGMKYRWKVVDLERHGRPVKSSQCMSERDGWNQAEKYIEKLLSGKRKYYRQ